MNSKQTIVPDKYRLNYDVIKTISKQYNICNSFIDLFNYKSYKGKRYMHNGRVIIEPAINEGQKCRYIIIDKDHTTRYLVQNIISYSTPQHSQKFFMNIITFQGYKMQLNKYMIYGQFQHFNMQSYSVYFGFEYFQAQMEEKGRQLLFCKIKNGEKNRKYYFDRDLTCIRQIELQEQLFIKTDYFSESISDPTLQNLNKQSNLSTKIINYFFNRLMFSYYSRIWYQKALPFVKTFQSQSLASFFFCKNEKDLDYSLFQSRLFNMYVCMGKNAFEQQELIIFPVFQLGHDHFVLGIIKADQPNKKISLYQLDPFDVKSGDWRNKLQYILKYNEKIIKQNDIPYSQHQIQLYNSIASISAPRQITSNDCGIYICLYSLMLMNQSALIELDEELKQMCKVDMKGKELIKYMRKYLFYSYQHRDTYFIDGFQNKFKDRLNKYKQECQY